MHGSNLARGMVFAAIVGLMQGGAPGRQRQQDEPPIRLETTLVQVPVVVSGPGGRYFTDLKIDDFELYEDGVKQTIEFFGSVDAPFNVALLIDSSGSTIDQLDLIKAAALAFIDQLRAYDRVMVVSFDDEVRIHCDLTSDRPTLESAVIDITPGEYTQVYEAVYTAIWERLCDVEGRKAVILFTDGVDTASSEIRVEDTLNAVIESEDVIVYPVRYATRADMERRMLARVEPNNPERAREALREMDRRYREADQYLHELATISGGVLERADRIFDLKDALGRIAQELRQQYLLGYYPPRTVQRDRAIRVQVKREGARVRARPRYRAN